MYSGNLKEATLTSLPFAINKAGKPVEREHSDGGGLYLVVGPTGTQRTGDSSKRRWIFKFQWQGKLTRMGLGTLEMVGVQEARRQAFENRKLVHAGKNPITERDAAAARAEGALTFQAFCAKIRKNAVHGMAPKSIARWDRGVNVYAKHLHGMKVGAITKHDIVACLDPIWLDIQVAAKKFQGQLYDIFKTAIAADVYPEGKVNPASWEILQKLLAKQDHKEKAHKSLPYQELPAAWQRIVAIESVASWTAQWTVLNGVRTGEALQVRKDAVVPFLDSDQPRWEIPGKVMKNGKPANVPLSKQAIALVRKVLAWQAQAGIADQTELLFPGQDCRNQQSENTVLYFLQKQAGIDATTHGCRSTLRSWGGDQDGIERDALEHCLHHILGDDAEAAYNKAEQWNKRLRIFQAWADYATGGAAPRKVGRPELTVVAA